MSSRPLPPPRPATPPRQTPVSGPLQAAPGPATPPAATASRTPPQAVTSPGSTIAAPAATGGAAPRPDGRHAHPRPSLTPLLRIWRVMWRGHRGGFVRAGLAMLVVALAGTGLLALSGWFITAASLAGLIGAGLAFDVFAPAAGVRGLAIIRTAGRYGERLASHDATLRATAGLRLAMLRHWAAAPFATLAHLRRGPVLAAILRDSDRLDALPLRVVLPLLTGGAALALVAAGLVWLTTTPLAVWIIGSHLAGAALAMALARPGAAAARAEAAAARRFESRLLDVIRARADLAVYGQLSRRLHLVTGAETRRRHAAAGLDRAERLAGAILSATTAISLSGALVLAAQAVAAGQISAGLAGAALLTALAVEEITAPLRRALAEWGALRDAAARVAPALDAAPQDGTALPPPPLAPAPAPAPVAPVPASPTPLPHGPAGAADASAPSGTAAPASRTLVSPTPASAAPDAPALWLDGVSVAQGQTGRVLVSGLSLRLAPGQTVALTGHSGAGKSSLLHVAAGLAAPLAGRVLVLGRDLRDWPQPALRQHLTLLPQRSALIAGSVADNLRLADPQADRARLEQVLAVTCLDDLAGGPDRMLGDGGAGLSGGQARRLALARALLRRPDILLLDEPTEGLDPATARRVLANLRTALPACAILLASHRRAERDWSDRLIHIG
ncbi:ATP-binding cassette domain-containing protein [Paracoccus sp. p1-h21]|uniref:ATP-binding cassette domain-containing protein n=1 Tax=unclassified Paracoccus (in: a-proteobacteria) TaxID=2688777 RepID=UPI00379C7E50